MASVRCQPARWGIPSTRLPARLVGISVLALPACADPVFSSQPNTYFPLGVFYQPAQASGTTSFAGWKGRGINTLIGWETQGNTVSIDTYSAAAVAAGMYMIRQPRANPADDANQANLLAFLQPDEPEDDGVSIATVQANYAAWKAAVPSMPVMVNFDGSRVIGIQGGVSKAAYQQYLQGADLAAEDIYPVTGFLDPGHLVYVSQAVDTLRSYTANVVTGQTKPVMAFIETSNQRLFAASHPDWNARGVTPGEFREEVWDALIHGANGILYFSQSFSAFRYDATPIDVAAEMTRQNATITSLAPVLNSSDAPDVSSVTLTGGLEAMAKSYNGITYLFVLNETGTAIDGTLSANFSYGSNGLQVLGEDRTIYSSDGQTFTDSFAPFGVHIYAEGPGGSTPLGINAPTPEPATALLALGAIAVVPRRARRGRGPLR